jgi:hypothetical protein
MSSGLANYGRIHFDDLQWTHRYRPNLAYAQSKLADLLFAIRLAGIASERGWNLVSAAAHPGFTRTNLQLSGPNLGRETPRWTVYGGIGFIPSHHVTQATEPLLFAATDPAATSGGYYGPNGRFGLVGTTTDAHMPKRAHNTGTMLGLWAEAERLAGVSLPDESAERQDRSA